MAYRTQVGKQVLQLFAFLGDRFFKSLGTFFAHFFPGLFGHLFFHFARVLDLRGDLRGIKPGYSHFEVVQLAYFVNSLPFPAITALEEGPGAFAAQPVSLPLRA